MALRILLGQIIKTSVIVTTKKIMKNTIEKTKRNYDGK